MVGRPHNKRRNTLKMAEHWRETITQGQLTKIESWCSDVITEIDHRIFYNVTRVKDQNISLINKSK